LAPTPPEIGVSTDASSRHVRPACDAHHSAIACRCKNRIAINRRLQNETTCPPTRPFQVSVAFDGTGQRLERRDLGESTTKTD
jgi:hypothetical protein